MDIVGVDRETGAPLSGIAHLKQSLADLLSTPLGSRRERPDYGSRLRRMVDLPTTRGWIADAQAEAARAIRRWEPRIQLRRVVIESVLDGRIGMRVVGEYVGATFVLELTV